MIIKRFNCTTTPETLLGEWALDMPGSAGSFGEMVRSAELVRLADCTVAPDRIDHFVRAQRDVWAPGMASAPGMLGGIFMRVLNEEPRFVVATFWSSADDHDRYVTEKLPVLRDRAGTEPDLVSISGSNLLLERGWTVLGSPGEA